MSTRLRHDPPAPRPSWIPRPRLAQRLERRFELSLLVVAAPAGYGKTAALSQALAAQAHVEGRRDAWLQCQAGDEDGELLGPAIMGSLGMPVRPGDVVDAATITDALLRYSPAQVCLVLDDVHVLVPGSGGLELVAELYRTLPRNGHLLLSGRTVPPLPLSRGLLQGVVEQLGSDVFAFDDDELTLVLPDGPDDLGDAARWPALSALVESHIPPGAIELMLGEVAGPPGSERRTLLAALAHLSEVDDDTLRVAGGTVDLLAELPLVQRSPQGTFQMHDLWRDALVAPDGPHPDPAVRAILARMARTALEGGDELGAAELSAAAGDDLGVAAAARACAERPLMSISAARMRRMATVVERCLPDHPVTNLLSMSVSVTGDERTTAEAYEALARGAATSGDTAVEVLALYNAANMRSVLDPHAIPAWLGDRADTLVAAGHEAARVTSVMVRSNRAQAEGRADDAQRILEELVPPSSRTERVVLSFGLNDLGRPENVATPGPDEAANAAEIYLAAALWLRGEVSPELALAAGLPMLDAVGRSGFAHLLVQANAVFSLIAVVAGQPGTARGLADVALREATASASVPVRTFARLADVVCTAGEGDEGAAAARLAQVLDDLPIGGWPARPYLFALPTVYALAPAVRPVLDGCRFGPALAMARQAGAAVVALVERGDPEPAASLPWSRSEVLRAHVVPAHLALLAAAASASGNGDVGPVLAVLPSCREHLVAATTLRHGPTASWAAQRVASLPARPPYDLRLRVLGPMELARGDTPVADRSWTHRDRVRQILAYLVLHRSVPRRRLAEVLWPDMPVEKALGNLRVSMAHLQQVLQPGRPADEKPWFVRRDNEMISLASDGVEVDAIALEEACAGARKLDEQGRVREAMVHLGRAVDLFQGDYLKDWPEAEWTQVERFRLRSLAIGARCRLGELQLARGEPEEAARHATQVLGAEPLQERACRLLVQALAAQSDRATAVRAMRDLYGHLVAQGLEPEPATVRLAQGLGLVDPGR